MSITIEAFPIMPTRPCSFCLCLQGGSVFADFDADQTGVISLRRISFDGFGCYEMEEPNPRMEPVDSRLLLESINQSKVGIRQVEEILQRFFRANAEVIWSDALAEHDLL